jgi:arylsulfatase A-like enzyme
VVKWPGKVKAGSSTDVPCYFPDWFPTLMEIGSTDLRKELLDGVSLVPVLTGGAFPKRREPMIWEFNGYRGIIALRDGKWKALRRGLKSKKGPSSWELYDLDVDPNEKNNLAKNHPEMVQRLEKMWLKTRTVEPDFPLPIVDKK